MEDDEKKTKIHKDLIKIEIPHSIETMNQQSTKPLLPVTHPKDVTIEKPVNAFVWNLMFVAGAALYSSYTIFVHLCEVDGKLPFSTGSVWLNVEIAKFFISLSLFTPEIREKGFPRPTFSYVIPFAVPAVLYTLNNNLATYMQLEMDASSYQMFCNFKILSTALLYRLIIKKPITLQQWIALGILLAAGILNSYGGFKTSSDNDSTSIHVTALGLIMLTIYVTVSGLSGVYTEYVLKKRYESSIHYQNMLLYLFGIILNGATFLTQGLQSSDSNSLKLFHGYSIWTWLLVLTQAFCGLIISAVMKHASNIAKIFLYGGAMLFTTVASILIFGTHLNIYYCVSFIMVIVAMYLYFKS